MAALAASVVLLDADTAVAGSKSWAKGRILVRPHRGTSRSNLRRQLQRHRGRSLRRLRGLDVHVVEVPAHAEERIAKALRRNPHIRFAERDMVATPSDFNPNDTYYSSCWHLKKINAPAAWDDASGKGVKVAVLDTGVDPTHSDLKDQLLTGWNSVSDSTITSDVMGHGTRVAGIVAAATNNGNGVASVAWGAKILPVRVTNSSIGYAYMSDIANGLVWAADQGAKVANISYDVTGSSAVLEAAEYMYDKGGVVVVAAGNSGYDPGYDDSPYVITVAATTSSDTRASWSSYGDYVDVSAPGVQIWTTANGGAYTAPTGTSYSSPMTAGVVALILSANSDLSPSKVEAILEDTADDLGASGWDEYFGYGRINAEEAVAAALQGKDTQNPTVSVVRPSSGAEVSGDVIVDVSASDNVGVAKVDLLVGGSRAETDSAAPFSFTWDSTTVSDGTVSISARAYDAAGNTAVSAGVQVTVDNVVEQGDTTPPTVKFKKPTDGGKIGRRVRIRVSAADDVGVVSLKLYIDGKLRKSRRSSSLRYTWYTRRLSSGLHTIKAVATDAAGNSATATIELTKTSSLEKSRGKKK